MSVAFQAFASREAANQSLADDIADRLGAAVAARGQALFIAAGGSTPEALYRTLAPKPLPWDRITVLPSDARWLAEDNAASNEGLLRRTLLQGPAAAARLQPLFGPEPTPADALPRLSAMIAALPPPDLALLGMGEDGHTASWFPGAQGLAAALDPDNPAPIAAITASGAAATAERLTLTVSVLRRARTLRVLIFGQAKRAVFERAMQAGPVAAAPIRALLHQTAIPVEVFWAA